MPIIDTLLEKMTTISNTNTIDEYKGFIETAEVSIIKPAEKEIQEYDPYEFLIGSVIELEHTEDALIAMSIALNHLDEMPDYYSQYISKMEPDFDAKKMLEYQTPGGSNINVARMIKNMSKVHVPKFDSKRNIKDRLKNLFKMPTAKDDMNAANSNRESFPNKPNAEKDALPKPEAEKPVEIIETKGLDNGNFSLVGTFINENEATDVLKDLLAKKRNAKMGQNKDGRFEVTVEESFIKAATPENGLGHIEGGKEYIQQEDNTMDNSGALMGAKVLPVSTVKKKTDSI